MKKVLTDAWLWWSTLPAPAQSVIAGVAMRHAVKFARQTLGDKWVDGLRVHGAVLGLAATAGVLNELVGLGFAGNSFVSTFLICASAGLSAIGFNEVVNKGKAKLDEKRAKRKATKKLKEESAEGETLG